MEQKTFRITRAGCLAVHLMPEYSDKKLQDAVKRIMERGPHGKFEREAVRKANLNDCQDPLIKDSEE